MSSFDLGTDFPAKAAVNAPHHSRGFAPDGAVSVSGGPAQGDRASLGMYRAPSGLSRSQEIKDRCRASTSESSFATFA